jgi:hypothetical protein
VFGHSTLNGSHRVSHKSYFVPGRKSYRYSPSNIYLTFVSVKSLLESKEYVDSKKKIESAIKVYSESMGYLTATMSAELLRHEKDERREKIINWIWKEDYSQKHKMLHENRVPHTGIWFLETAAYKDWRNGTGSKILICTGIRKISF